MWWPHINVFPNIKLNLRRNSLPARCTLPFNNVFIFECKCIFSGKIQMVDLFCCLYAHLCMQIKNKSSFHWIFFSKKNHCYFCECFSRCHSNRYYRFTWTNHQNEICITSSIVNTFSKYICHMIFDFWYYKRCHVRIYSIWVRCLLYTYQCWELFFVTVELIHSVFSIVQM